MIPYSKTMAAAAISILALAGAVDLAVLRTMAAFD